MYAAKLLHSPEKDDVDVPQHSKTNISVVKQDKNFIFHAAAFMFFLHTVLVDRHDPAEEDKRSFVGRSKYATVWILYTTAFYYTIALTVELVSLLQKHIRLQNSLVKALFHTRDFLFVTFVFTVGLSLTIIFWGVYVIDPDQIMRDEIQKVNPIHGWHNHAIHTAPMVVCFLDVAIVTHKVLGSRPKGMMILGIWLASYILWITFVVYRLEKRYPYPLFDESAVTRVCVWIIWYAIMVINYLFGRYLMQDKKVKGE